MKRFLLLPIALLLVSAPGALAQETTLGGYGELHYNDPEGATPGELDFHRFVLYIGHSFNDWISFASEVEVEHVYLSDEGGPGELGIEQAYVEFQPWDSYGFRGGIVLIPVGIINPIHEPPTFHGVERPSFHRIIIPTTWREAGLGFYGMPFEKVAFQLYYTSSFDANGFSLSSGLRGGRTKAAEPKTSDMALSGRVDVYPTIGLIVGGSFFTGSTTRGAEELGDGTTTILAADARYSIGDFEFRGEFANISIADTELLFEERGISVAEQIMGYYIEGAYNFLPLLFDETAQKLFVFARYEGLNTEASLGEHLEETGRYDRTEITLGLTYKPTTNVAVKLDYQIYGNGVDDETMPGYIRSGADGQLNAGVGYAF
ncbi:MAG: hypothetical protein CL946_08090 [Ectothiorhodospiraceae bacterium]|nr:hypothetical protein [Ectothiorhodospiraceae bacterium]